LKKKSASVKRRKLRLKDSDLKRKSASVRKKKPKDSD